MVAGIGKHRACEVVGRWRWRCGWGKWHGVWLGREELDLDDGVWRAKVASGEVRSGARRVRLPVEPCGVETGVVWIWAAVGGAQQHFGLSAQRREFFLWARPYMQRFFSLGNTTIQIFC